MDNDQWKQVKEIFNAAVELPPAERLAFIVRKSDGDALVINEVHELLQSDEEAEDFIENPTVVVSQLLSEEISLVGKKIGSYVIEKEIGRGGMGAVYLALRSDEHFTKRVAVKLIKRGYDTDDIIRRFRHERQILAALDHPNITRLLDGGATEDGLPYLVMDYVEGLPLTRFCEEKQLSVRERLNLFLQICSAVTYAHQNLIIHRDIKPSNVLITIDGVPKLLDFGIAKLTVPDARQQTLERHSTHLMTPEYASPEQILGQPITTTTDIYSLGIVLYELLTAHRPFRIKSNNPVEISKIITDSAPLKPSSVVTRNRKIGERHSAISVQLRGDLDNIILMAIRKEPERRYSSVEQFAEDIRRYLNSLPVLAREDSFSYRAAKFVQRNKAGVAAGAGIAVSLIFGIASTLRQSRIARHERDNAVAEAEKAVREAEKAEKINKFLQKMLNSADPRVAGKDVKVVQVLDLAAQSLEKDLAGQPEIAADLQNTIGLTYLSLGLFEQAEPHLQQALETRRLIFGENARETALSLGNFGRLLQAKGELKKAEPLYLKALEILRGSGAEAEMDLATVLHNYGYLVLLRGEHAEGIRIHREELQIHQSYLGENHPETAKTLSRLGNAFRLTGDLQTAQIYHRRALEIFQKSYGDEHPDVAQAMLNLVGVVYQFEDGEAERLCRETLRIQRKVLGEHHPEVAVTLYDFAYLSIQKGDAEKARQYADEVLRLRGTHLDDEHPVISGAMLVLGRALMQQEKIVEAEKILRECFELRQRTLTPNHWLVATAKVIWGECLGLLGDNAAAGKCLKEGYETLLAKLGAEHDQTKMARQKLENWHK